MQLRLMRANSKVGDIASNTAQVIAAHYAATHNATPIDLLVLSECFLSGYPPKDLLHKTAFVRRVHMAIEAIATQTQNSHTAILLGTPYMQNDLLYNSALLIKNGTVSVVANKIMLPNTQVFDEPRVFTAGTPLPPFTLGNIKFGALICEDMWHQQQPEYLRKAGAQVLLSLNASPFARDKPLRRRRVMLARVHETGLPLAAVFQVGGQDDLWFDGGNAAFNPHGLALQAPHNQVGYDDITLVPAGDDAAVWHFQAPLTASAALPSTEEGIYSACVGALRDYAHKNGLQRAILGLSGGMDSSLTACIAVDALGAANVDGLILPSRFSSQHSVADAQQLAQNLRMQQTVIPIEGAVNMLRQTLPTPPSGVVDENLQARTRGIVLMAHANNTGALLLSTGNKSELAVGYATLYGDMCGGYNVLKDLYKTQTYDLARYRNSIKPAIPDSVFSKAPSAELREQQTDQDTLPPYDVLDRILQHLIENNGDCRTLQGVADMATIERVENMLYAAEHKRQQAVLGVRLSECAFSTDRRYPIVCGFRSARV